MKTNRARVKKFIIVLTMAAMLAVTLSEATMDAWATTIREVEEDINNTQNELNEINANISDMEDEQELLEEQMEDLNAEIVNILASIEILREDIAAKVSDIAQTEQEYEAALKREQDQAEAMTLQIQFMYETGDPSLVAMLFSEASFSDMLNRITYAKRVNDYNQEMLDQYEATRKEVHELWDRLEAEKAALEKDKAEMEEQKTYCDQLMAQLQEKSDNFAAQIARAKQDAAAAKALLQQEKKLLKQLKEEERKKEQERRRQAALAAAAQNPPSVTGSSSYNSIVDNAAGSDKGKQIAKYALQFVGNPYVAGGTSLTNGADCSGFTYRVYQDWGYSISRTSFSQRSDGQSVDYSDAQPGDILCYEGHVAMYIGGGKIVHASTAKTGIKVGNANYRPILAVRRII
ncbi:MAG: NlpC/P60 family protein [bacterium]|nr:NlpC/P60 family protein [bacterium]MCM1373786.1 NlpC/P60 family protein [Muribaculum sp.]